MTERDDAQLVGECLSGNVNAFETIVDRYQKPIYNAALRIVHNRDDAEDIVQSVFVKLYENLAAFNPKHKLFSWIYRMAINESINFIKQKRAAGEPPSTLLALDKTPEENYSAAALRESLLGALMKLDIDYRVVIILRYFEGFSYEEISYIIEVPEKTVKSRLFSARQNLREILIKEGVTPND
jgi:RNA polymerase sigma-70 factor (ECF subfamily)